MTDSVRQVVRLLAGGVGGLALAGGAYLVGPSVLEWVRHFF